MIENKQGSDLFFPILSLLFGLTWKKSTLKYGRIPIGETTFVECGKGGHFLRQRDTGRNRAR
jgi:hypothetical protein